MENRVIAVFRCTSWTCTWRLMAFVAGGADWEHWGMAGLGKSLWEGRLWGLSGPDPSLTDASVRL